MYRLLYRASYLLQVHGRHIKFLRQTCEPVVCYNVCGQCCVRKLCTDSSSSPATHSQSQSTQIHSISVEGPSFKDFIQKDASSVINYVRSEEAVPYVDKKDFHGNNRQVYIETYGCQMNVSDTEIAWSVLQSHGFCQASNICDSDVILLMTCSIREGAEQKIWKRLEFLKRLKLARQKLRSARLPPVKIGILGCMAERLKTRLLEQHNMVDVVCGPDAYRDLPRLLAITDTGQSAVNVQLSIDETYADISPVRTDANMTSAFVSIMRGCNNMCSYCIVPFTRGRERSRPVDSIVEEVKHLSDEGYKEVTLLGQNVNSYRDTSALSFAAVRPSPPSPSSSSSCSHLSAGFHTVYRHQSGGLRFADLLSRVADVNPQMRVRFTSPHPKDFPDDLLYVIRDMSNVCCHIHLPAQSGSTQVLSAMRRGYTADAYIDLVNHIRHIIPAVSLSSDFIAGFCGETESDHEMTLDLIRRVKYNFVYCFPYSMRQKTRAAHHLVDDVSGDVKRRRHEELVDTFRLCARQLNESLIGEHRVVLIDQVSKRSVDAMAGRTESNVRVIVPQAEIPTSSSSSSSLRYIQPGDYVVVQIKDATSQVMTGTALHHTTLTGDTSSSL